MMKGRLNTPEQFWTRVDKTPVCWIWLGGKTPLGYGRLRVGSRYWLAHRYAWNLVRGPIPGKLFLCHHCDNPSCVNPDHLFLGTNRDNALDMFAKGRDAQSCGHNRSAKLDEALVIEMRAAFRRGETCRSIAKRLGVSESTASFAIKGRTWRKVPGAVDPHAQPKRVNLQIRPRREAA